MNEGENKRYDVLVNGNIRKVVPRLVMPTIISITVSSIYNMVDTFFISRLGTSALGAVGITSSAMAIAQALSFTIGIGAGNHMTHCPGTDRAREGKTAVSVAFFTDTVLSICLGFVCLLHIGQTVMFLGATETIKSYTAEYTRYIFVATPFTMYSLIMNNLLCPQGLAAFAMIGATVGGILNVTPNPLLVFSLSPGTSGAAIAIGFSRFISFCILPARCNRGKGCTPVRLRNFRPSLSLHGKIIYGGMLPLTRQGMASTATIVLDTTIHLFGDTAVAVMAIVNRLVYFINPAVIGLGRGFQPVCAFSYGAKKCTRVRQVYIFCVEFTTCILIVACVGAFLISGYAVSLFRRDDPAVIAIGTLTLRLQLITMWFNGFLIMNNMMSQPIGYGSRAALPFISRQGLFLILTLPLTAHSPGLLGIQVARPIAGVCTPVLTAFIIHGIFQSFPQEFQEVRDI